MKMRFVACCATLVLFFTSWINAGGSVGGIIWPEKCLTLYRRDGAPLNIVCDMLKTEISESSYSLAVGNFIFESVDESFKTFGDPSYTSLVGLSEEGDFFVEGFRILQPNSNSTTAVDRAGVEFLNIEAVKVRKTKLLTNEYVMHEYKLNADEIGSKVLMRSFIVIGEYTQKFGMVFRLYVGRIEKPTGLLYITKNPELTGNLVREVNNPDACPFEYVYVLPETLSMLYNPETKLNIPIQLRRNSGPHERGRIQQSDPTVYYSAVEDADTITINTLQDNVSYIALNENGYISVPRIFVNKAIMRIEVRVEPGHQAALVFPTKLTKEEVFVQLVPSGKRHTAQTFIGRSLETRIQTKSPQNLKIREVVINVPEQLVIMESVYLTKEAEFVGSLAKQLPIDATQNGMLKYVYNLPPRCTMVYRGSDNLNIPVLMESVEDQIFYSIVDPNVEMLASLEKKGDYFALFSNGNTSISGRFSDSETGYKFWVQIGMGESTMKSTKLSEGRFFLQLCNTTENTIVQIFIVTARNENGILKFSLNLPKQSLRTSELFLQYEKTPGFAFYVTENPKLIGTLVHRPNINELTFEYSLPHALLKWNKVATPLNNDTWDQAETTLRAITEGGNGYKYNIPEYPDRKCISLSEVESNPYCRLINRGGGLVPGIFRIILSSDERSAELKSEGSTGVKEQSSTWISNGTGSIKQKIYSIWLNIYKQGSKRFRMQIEGIYNSSTKQYNFACPANKLNGELWTWTVTHHPSRVRYHGLRAVEFVRFDKDSSAIFKSPSCSTGAELYKPLYNNGHNPGDILWKILFVIEVSEIVQCRVVGIEYATFESWNSIIFTIHIANKYLNLEFQEFQYNGGGIGDIYLKQVNNGQKKSEKGILSALRNGKVKWSVLVEWPADFSEEGEPFTLSIAGIPNWNFWVTPFVSKNCKLQLTKFTSTGEGSGTGVWNVQYVPPGPRYGITVLVV